MLTTEQLATLRAGVFSNPEAAAFLAAGNWQEVQAWLNTTSTPNYIVWKTAVTQDEIMQNGFDWVRVDNLSIGKARIWEWLFANDSRIINPSKANVRAGIDEVWKGTAADLAVRDAVYVHCKRTATKAEQLLATGTGSTLAPGIVTFEGEVNQPDAIKIVYRDDATIWTQE